MILLGAGLLAMVWLQDRTAQRMAQERKDWQQERAGLLQRIQAPERAVIEHATRDARDQPAVNAFDHQDYWEAKEEEQQALARIAQLEREMN